MFSEYVSMTLILGYIRSGSSLTGDIVHCNQETFIYLNLLSLQLKETDLKKEILKVLVTQHILYQGRVFSYTRYPF